MLLLSSCLSLPHHLSGSPSHSLNLSLATFHCGWGVQGRNGRHRDVTSGLMGCSVGAISLLSQAHTLHHRPENSYGLASPSQCSPQGRPGGPQSPSHLPFPDAGNQRCLHGHKWLLCSGARRPDTGLGPPHQHCRDKPGFGFQSHLLLPHLTLASPLASLCLGFSLVEPR